MRFRFIPPVLLSAMLALGSTVPLESARAQSGDAVSQERADLERAYEDAFQSMFQDPGNLDKAFAFAQLAVQVGDFEGAISTLERMLLIDPDLPRVRLELGVLYFRLRSYQVAEGYLREVFDDPDAPAPVKQRVSGFLDEIAKQTSPHLLTGSVFVGLRHQSNANAGPTTSEVRVLGLDATLDSQFTDQADVDQFVAAQLKHAYDFGVEPRIELENELTAYGSNQANQDQLDTGLVQLRTGPRFTIDPDIARGLDIRPYARADIVNLADRLYYTGYGAGIEGNYALGARTGLSFDTSLVERTYNNSSANEGVKESLSGPRGDVDVSLTHILSASTRLSVTGGVFREDTASDGRANWRYEAGASVTELFDSPMPELTGPWSLTVSARAAHTPYDSPDASIDPDVTREDNEWLVQTIGTVRLRDNISLVGTGLYKKVDSNISNFEYDNWAFSIGLAVQF